RRDRNGIECGECQETGKEPADMRLPCNRLLDPSHADRAEPEQQVDRTIPARRRARAGLASVMSAALQTPDQALRDPATVRVGRRAGMQRKRYATTVGGRIGRGQETVVPQRFGDLRYPTLA